MCDSLTLRLLTLVIATCSLLIAHCFCMERGAISACRAKHFKRGYKAGLYRKNNAGMWQYGIPAYLVMDAFQAVGAADRGLIHHIHYTLMLNIAPASGAGAA